MRLDEGFDARSVRWFERLFGAALLVEVATQVTSGVWSVHAGSSYPWRHLDLVPLAPPALVAIEWLLVALGAAALIAGRARTMAWRVLAPLLLWSVLQRFSNHGSLFFMIAFFVAMAPPADSLDETTEHPNLGLVRAQIVIVYVMSALAKLFHGFTSGASLVHLFGLAPGLARAASWGVIAGELALAVLVVKRPRIAIVAAAVMHGAFALVIPNVLSFGIAMVAMAALWLRPALSPERGGPSPSPSDRAASDALPPPPRT